MILDTALLGSVLFYDRCAVTRIHYGILLETAYSLLCFLSRIGKSKSI